MVVARRMPVEAVVVGEVPISRRTTPLSSESWTILVATLNAALLVSDPEVSRFCWLMMGMAGTPPVPPPGETTQLANSVMNTVAMGYLLGAADGSRIW